MTKEGGLNDEELSGRGGDGLPGLMWDGCSSLWWGGGGGWGGAVDRESRTASQINRGDVKSRRRETGACQQDGCLTRKHAFKLPVGLLFGLGLYWLEEAS